ncbi:MAG: hypothetical protein PHG66_02075 [Candidatus Colwellbacteria bacterium]|nr:hypothetical protein [Candidatus Colwellbacteria bacterium]
MPPKTKLDSPMTVEEIQQYVHQTKDTKCVSILQKNKRNIPYDFIKKKRNTECVNRTSMSDDHISLYSEDQLLFYNDDDSLYCFKYDETDHLLKTRKNPFNGKPLDKKFITTLTELSQTDPITGISKNIKYQIPVYPLDKALDMYQESGTCFRMPSFNKNVAYYISFKPMTLDELSPNIAVNNRAGGTYMADNFISTSYDTADLGVLFVYRVHTKSEIDFSKAFSVNSSDINMLEKVFSSDDIETVNPSERTYKIEDKNVIKELTNFMHYSGTLSAPVLETLKSLHIKEFFPIKAYRGLSFPDASFINRYKVGDKFTLYSKNRVQSWSSTHCVSEHFASYNMYGVLVSIILDPEDIAIDTRFLEMNQLKAFFWREQREIMSVPFDDKGKEKEFLVTVESILIGPKSRRITDIRSMKYFSGIPEKDIDIMDYKIGLPVTHKEAFENFLNIGRHIDMSIIPKEQKGLISDGMFTDPISMEEVPLEFVLQLKQCGTLLSKDSLDSLIDTTKSVWQKRENIAFKSPVTNTIYGNLVLYNYSEDFLPQKNGVLSIKLIKTSPIKETKKTPAISDWYEISYLKSNRTPYNFRSTAMPVKMYYPQNDAGTKIVTLMCDCFKKGNLFAFDNTDQVRHGRVHKKTSLDDNEFGYPDDTYEMRVTGELMGLGSTPYTSFFGKQRSVYDYAKFIDPYPDEERWLIDMPLIDVFMYPPSLVAPMPIPLVPAAVSDEVSDANRKRIEKYVTKAITSIDEGDPSKRLKTASLLFEYMKKNSVMSDPKLSPIVKKVVKVLKMFIEEDPDDEYLRKMYKIISGKAYKD